MIFISNEARSCERVVLDFMRYFDARQHDKMLPLFAEDGVWLRADGEVRGRESLRELLLRRNPQISVVHVITNLCTDIDDAGESAEVSSYVTVYRCDDQLVDGLPAPLDRPRLVGRYTDRLRKTGDHWQIVEKNVLVLFN